MSVSLIKDEDGFIFSGKLYCFFSMLTLTLPIAPSDTTTDPGPAGPSELDYISFGEYFYD